MLRSFVVKWFVVAVDSTGAATRAAVRRGIETNSARALSYRSSREPPAPRIVPEARYLEHGSVRALAEDLDRQGIRTKVRQLASGRTVGGARSTASPRARRFRKAHEPVRPHWMLL